MQKIHIRRKIVNKALRDGFARAPAPEWQTVESLQRINTTKLERLARDYERGMSLNEFERSAVLRAIATEITERSIEAKELRKGDR